jgi:phage terminase large subunit
MPDVSLPAWADCLFDESARYLAIRGGRGSGKSRSVASSLILRAAAKPLRILCAREVQKSIKDSVKRLLDDEIARLGLGEFFQSTETEIRGKNGSLFIFAGLRMNTSSIKSMEGVDICWVEEAATISQSSLRDLIPTIRKAGSQIIFTWNPRLITDPVDAMFIGVETPPPRTVLRRVNWDDNPWFPEELREEMEYDKRRDPDKYAHVWLGEYARNGEARVFKNWRIDEFDTPADAVHRFGADWGFSVDPTVLIRSHIVGRTLYIDYEAYQVGCDITDIPALFMAVPEAEKWPMTADSARPETISHLRKNGFPRIHPAVKGPRSLEEGVEWLKSFDIVVHPRCTHTINELTLYSYKVDELTEKVLPILADKDNHLIDALRYAHEGARRAQTTKAPPISIPLPSASHW